jgi:hypothetical protein
MRFLRAFAALLILTGPGRIWAQTPLDLHTPEYLPERAREMLRDRMARHGEDMMTLMAALLMLNYETAQEIALGISREPKLSRPGPQEKDTLNALLPRRFFDLQDLLVTRAKAVANAAAAADDARVMRAYGQLAETCLACHASYLRGVVP